MYDPALYIRDDTRSQVITFCPVEDVSPAPYEFQVDARTQSVAGSQRRILFAKADVLLFIDQLTVLCKANLGKAELKSSFDPLFLLLVKVANTLEDVTVGIRYVIREDNYDVGFSDCLSASYKVEPDCLFALLIYFKETVKMGDLID